MDVRQGVSQQLVTTAAIMKVSLTIDKRNDLLDTSVVRPFQPPSCATTLPQKWRRGSGLASTIQTLKAETSTYVCSYTTDALSHTSSAYGHAKNGTGIPRLWLWAYYSYG